MCRRKAELSECRPRRRVLVLRTAAYLEHRGLVGAVLDFDGDLAAGRLGARLDARRHRRLVRRRAGVAAPGAVLGHGVAEDVHEPPALLRPGVAVGPSACHVGS